MSNITLKYFSLFNNKPSASWVAHMTRGFFTSYSSAYYTSMLSIFCQDFLLLFELAISTISCWWPLQTDQYQREIITKNPLILHQIIKLRIFIKIDFRASLESCVGTGFPLWRLNLDTSGVHVLVTFVCIINLSPFCNSQFWLGVSFSFRFDSWKL